PNPGSQNLRVIFASLAATNGLVSSPFPFVSSFGNVGICVSSFPLVSLARYLLRLFLHFLQHLLLPNKVLCLEIHRLQRRTDGRKQTRICPGICPCFYCLFGHSARSMGIRTVLTHFLFRSKTAYFVPSSPLTIFSTPLQAFFVPDHVHQ